MADIEAVPVGAPRSTAQEEGLFTYFPQLPPELRDRIWDSYDHEARVIVLIVHDVDNIKELFKFQSFASPRFPGVNAESRKAVSRSHKWLTSHKTLSVNLSRDVFEFFHIAAYRSFLSFGRTKQIEGHVDNLMTLEDAESQLCHISFHSTTIRRRIWFELVRFRALRTITLTLVGHWYCTEEIRRCWEQKFQKAWMARHGSRECPQILWHNTGIDNPNIDRAWISQSAEGLWSWKTGPRGADAKMLDCIPKQEGREGEGQEAQGGCEDKIKDWNELDDGWEEEERWSSEAGSSRDSERDSDGEVEDDEDRVLIPK